MNLPSTVLEFGGAEIIGLHPIKAVYLGVLLFAMVMLATMNYWVTTRASTNRIQNVLLHHNAAILWALVAALGLLAQTRWLVLLFTYLQVFISYVVVILFVRFATIYSGRSTSLRRPFNAIFLAGMGIGLLALVTNPWHGLHFDPLVYHTDPFPYYESGFGPLWGLSLACTYVGLLVALYYLTELFFTSQHRSSRPLIVYVVGVGLSTFPSVLTATQSVPTLPGYDHSVFGLALSSIAFFLGAWQGMVKISPISRNRLLATTDDSLIIVDDDGLVADHNTVAETFFDESTPNVIGAPIADVAPDLAAILPADIVGSARDGDGDTSEDGATESQTVQFTNRTDGVKRRYSTVISPVTDTGTTQGYALLIRDVTERHEYREELRRQNEQLDEFASSISHYLRNPLQIASGQVDLACSQLDTETVEPADRDRLDELESSLERMDTIITDLRTLAKKGKSVESTAPIRLSDAVEEALTHIHTDGATVRVTRDGTIQADYSQLLSILENLVRNSLEHAGEDVTITLEMTDDGFVFRDDGPGIDADHDRLFEYGYTTSSDGTGLGLSIVETMVKSHGWQVSLEDDDDGAGFVISGAVTTFEQERI